MKQITVSDGSEERILEYPAFFVDDLEAFARQAEQSEIEFPITTLCPILNERFVQDKRPLSHYFYQDLIVAQKIYRNNPRKHVDIGSRVDGFVTHVASFRELELFDIRETPYKIPHVTFRQVDIMKDIKDSFKDYCNSISSLHVIEHLGLGRYGDPIAFEGYIKGLDSIYGILKRGGKFYFSVPMGGPQRIEFNAHRIFSLKSLLALFEGKYSIDSFSYEHDSGSFFLDVELTDENIEKNCDCAHGCAIFELTKL